MLGGLTFCALVAKLVKKWSHGFWAILLGSCHKRMQNEVSKVWLQKELILVGFWLSQVGWIDFLCLGSKNGEKMNSYFWAILEGNCDKCMPNEVWKIGCKRNWSWLGFGLGKLGGLAFCVLVAKLVKKWSHGFWAIFVGNSHKCIQNEVSKVWLQKELILVGILLGQVGWIGLLCLGSKNGEKVNSWFLSNLGGELSQMHPKWGVKSLVAKGIDLGWVFGLAKLGGLTFCALVAKLVKKWTHGFWAILAGNCDNCMPNEVWKNLLQKELILVGFCLRQVGWIDFLCFGSKIVEKVKSWFLSNIRGEFSKMHPKWGVQSLVANRIDLGWVFA